MIEVFTDGGAHNNDGPNKGIGGWGVVILKDGNELTRLSGGAKDTTNNRMELLALCYALRWLIKNGYAEEETTIQSDSQYTQNTVTTWMYGWAKKGWRTASGDPVKNVDIVQILYDLYPKVNVKEYKWVKGHAGHKWNELCDALATQEQQKIMGVEVEDRTQEILEQDPTYAFLNAMTKQEAIKYVIAHGFKIEE